MRTVATALLVLAALLAPGCLEPAGNGWAVQATQIDQVRADGATGRTIRVAILDSGIDLSHPSLGHLKDGRGGDGELVGYVDFVGASGGPRDLGGHGTFVAGVLAADPPDGLASVTAMGSSVRGLAPNVDLLVGRVCEKDHCGLIALWRALEWALEEDADIISLSLGYTPADLEEMPLIVDRINETLRNAEMKGVLVVAAAGNNQPAVLYPARKATVLAVGAIDRDGSTRDSSAPGLGSHKPDLVAPGQDIVGPEHGGGTIALDGTSAAVPFVVAAAALMMEAVHDPDDAGSLALLRQALLDTAAPLAGQRLPHDARSGHGLVQAGSAATRYAILAADLEDVEGDPQPWRR